MNSQKKKSKLSMRKRLLLALLILLLIIIGLVSFFITGAARANGGSPSPSSRSTPGSSSLVNNGSALPGGYTPKSRQEILSELQKEQVIVTDRLSVQISFPSGASGTAGTWVVENPATNKVIEQCEVVLNGKTVAESVPIDPGQHIDSITLSQKVAPGTYDVTATINYYSTDTKSLLGKAGYRIKLTVS
jgi:cell division protein YceG involved in septum cleavage